MKPPGKINFARQRKPMWLVAFAALWTSRVCSHRGCGALDRGKARRTASDLKGKRRLAAVGSLGCLRSQRCLCHKSTCTPWSPTAVRVRDRPSVGRTGRVPKRSRRPHALGYISPTVVLCCGRAGQSFGHRLPRVCDGARPTRRRRGRNACLLARQARRVAEKTTFACRRRLVGGSGV